VPLPLPSQPTDIVKLADWLELSALLSPDFNSSRGDLESALVAGAIFDDRPDDQEAALVNVFAEIARRAQFVAAYPFLVKAGVLTCAEPWDDKSSYVFCLCLSYKGAANIKGAKIYPRRIFELLSAQAVEKFISGTSYRFGSPRLPPAERRFKGAINQLCGLMKEGGPFSDEPILDHKDDGVDIVAWREELDQLSGKLLIFGACASGDDWDKKLGELMPKEFCETWMQRTPVSHPLKAFFVPHRLNLARWDYAARRAGIFFDRCRICKLIPILPDGGRFGDGLIWAKAMLAGLAA
jgi:hypothetical protein